MKPASLILLAALPGVSLSTYADSLGDIAAFADKICNQSLSGNESATTISGHLNADLPGYAKALGISVGAGGLVTKEGKHYDGIPKENLPSSIPTPAQCKLELAKLLIQERQRLLDANPAKLVTEYDFRLNEIETRDEEIKQAAAPDDKGALQMYIWRAVRGNSDFQPSLPEFLNTHLVGVIERLKEAGFTEHAKEAIQAARDLENGSPEAHSHQSPHGYGVFDQGFLDSRVKDLRSYSNYIHRKEGS